MLPKKTISVFSYLLSVLKPFYGFFLFQLIVGVISALFLPINSYYLKIIINTASDCVFLKSFSALWIVAIYYSLFTCFIVIVHRIDDIVSSYFMRSLRVYISKKVMLDVMRHSHSFFQKNCAGDLSQKMNDIIRALPAVEQLVMENFLVDVLMLIFSVVIVGFIHVQFSILLFLWIIVSLVSSLFLLDYAKKYTCSVAELHSKVVGYIVDFLSNIISVRIFLGKDQEINHFGSFVDEVRCAEYRRDIFFLKLNAFQAILFLIVQCISLYLLASGLQRGQFSPGDFGMMLSITFFITQSLWKIMRLFGTLMQDIGSLNRALSVILQPVHMQDNHNAQSLVVTRGEIVFENVHFAYPETPSLFVNKSVTILAHQKVGLVGYSGSGKSTFINLILRLYDVQSGRILIDGQNIAEITQKSLHDSIAVIGQESILFARSVMENIRYGNHNASDAMVIEAAKKAHAHEFIMQLQDGYNTNVGERGAKLSGGQRQRIAIARAILKNAPLLMLDEATSHLDSVTESAIQENFHQLMRGKTTLVIAHRLSTLPQMDRILVFDKGIIVQDGTHQDLVSVPGVYKKLWDAQRGGFLGDGSYKESEIIS